jgi:hypothetical protein
MAWRYGGHDPYRLFHMLDENYAPMGGGPVKPPPYPTRLRCVIYGFSTVASEQDAKRGF